MDTSNSISNITQSHKIHVYIVVYIVEFLTLFLLTESEEHVCILISAAFTSIIIRNFVFIYFSLERKKSFPLLFSYFSFVFHLATFGVIIIVPVENPSEWRDLRVSFLDPLIALSKPFWLVSGQQSYFSYFVLLFFFRWAPDVYDGTSLHLFSGEKEASEQARSYT